jgi:hypothetical protein
LEIAAQAPSTFAYIVTTPTGKEDIFGDATTTTSCSQKSGASASTCEQLPSSIGSSLTSSLGVFTGKYWSEALAATAGHGATVSSMTVGGQSSQCLTYSPSSTVDGEICVTGAGVLSYVKDLKSGYTMSLTSYSSSPSASLFQTPAGATVSTVPAGA